MKLSNAIAAVLGIAVMALTAQAEAQWMYTDNKGVSKTVQYKMDIPGDYRDAAVFAGKVGASTVTVKGTQMQNALEGRAKAQTALGIAQERAAAVARPYEQMKAAEAVEHEIAQEQRAAAQEAAATRKVEQREKAADLNAARQLRAVEDQARASEKAAATAQQQLQLERQNPTIRLR